MPYIEPIELLKDKCREYERALHKSFEAWKAGQINEDLHITHKNNLQPIIFKYKQAISVLEGFNR